MRISNHAFFKGRVAYVVGKSLCDCPYKTGFNRELWEDGFMDSQIENEEFLATVCHYKNPEVNA